MRVGGYVECRGGILGYWESICTVFQVFRSPCWRVGRKAMNYKPGVAIAFQRALACRDTACLIWPYGHDGDGYGAMRWRGRTRRVHVLVCEALHGPRPSPKHHVSHSCHNGAGGCVNGSHLSWLSGAENRALARGRKAKNKKLDPDSVREIRRMRSSGLFTLEETGRHFGVHAQTIYDVMRGHIWDWVVDL